MAGNSRPACLDGLAHRIEHLGGNVGKRAEDGAATLDTDKTIRDRVGRDREFDEIRVRRGRRIALSQGSGGLRGRARRKQSDEGHLPGLVSEPVERLPGGPDGILPCTSR